MFKKFTVWILLFSFVVQLIPGRVLATTTSTPTTSVTVGWKYYYETGTSSNYTRLRFYGATDSSKIVQASSEYTDGTLSSYGKYADFNTSTKWTEWRINTYNNTSVGTYSYVLSAHNSSTTETVSNICFKNSTGMSVNYRYQYTAGAASFDLYCMYQMENDNGGVPTSVTGGATVASSAYGTVLPSTVFSQMSNMMIKTIGADVNRPSKPSQKSIAACASKATIQLFSDSGAASAWTDSIKNKILQSSIPKDIVESYFTKYGSSLFSTLKTYDATSYQNYWGTQKEYPTHSITDQDLQAMTNKSEDADKALPDGLKGQVSMSTTIAAAAAGVIVVATSVATAGAAATAATMGGAILATELTTSNGGNETRDQLLQKWLDSSPEKITNWIVIDTEFWLDVYYINATNNYHKCLQDQGDGYALYNEKTATTINQLAGYTTTSAGQDATTSSSVCGSITRATNYMWSWMFCNIGEFFYNIVVGMVEFANKQALKTIGAKD